MAIERTSMRTTKLTEMNSNFKHCCPLDKDLGCFKRDVICIQSQTLQVNKKKYSWLVYIRL